MKRVDKADAVDRRRRHPEQIEHRGHDIDQSYDVRHSARLDAGDAHDEWDPQHALVDKSSVIAFAVIAERLSMIGRYDHYRSFREITTFERVEEPSYLQIRKRYFGDVGIPGP